jgi:YggT family protein
MASFLATFVEVLFRVLTYAIFARVLLSWFPIRPDNPLILILDEVTEPIMRPLRRIVPRLGMLDITPIVAIVVLQLLQSVLIMALQRL